MAVTKRKEGGRPAGSAPVAERRREGLLWGVFYGLVPHTFCILFIVFSVVGATLATSFVQRVLLVPYLFQVIVALSVGLATLSAAIYLRRNGLLSRLGIRRKWRYLATLYGTTLAVNMLFFWVIFPAVAGFQSSPRVSAAGVTQSIGAQADLTQVTIQVAIPCAGHAPLVLGYLKKTPGVYEAQYISPDRFRIAYSANGTTLDQVLDQEIFRAFETVVIPWAS